MSPAWASTHLAAAGIRLGEDDVGNRMQPEVDAPRCLVEFARFPVLVHPRDGGRRQVRGGGDEPRAAQREQWQAEQLDPGPDEGVAAGHVQHPGEVLEVPGGLLDPDDVVVLAAQPRDGFRRDVDRGAGRHVVGDDRQAGELAARPRCTRRTGPPGWAARSTG